MARLVRAQAPERAVAERILGALALACFGCAVAGLAWASIDPRGGGATLAFCAFVACLVARAAKWWL